MSRFQKIYLRSVINLGISAYKCVLDLVFPIDDGMGAGDRVRLNRSKLSFLIEKKSKMRYRCMWKYLNL